jgi:hypothetical protein
MEYGQHEKDSGTPHRDPQSAAMTVIGVELESIETSGSPIWTDTVIEIEGMCTPHGPVE